MKPKLISLIAPIFNIKKYLIDFLTSIKNIRYENFEIILVDDGSTDGCDKILDDFASSFSKAKVIHQNNRGVSSARNLGLKNSKGDYVLFVDPDDVIHPDSLRIYSELIDKYNSDVVITGFKKIGESTHVNLNAKIKKISKSKIYNGCNDIMCQYLSISPFFWSPWNKLYKRAILEKIECYPNVFPKDCYDGDDALFNSKALSNCHKAVYNPAQLYFWRIRKGSYSHKEFNERNITLLKNSEFLLTLDKEKFKESQNYIKSKACMDNMILLYKFSRSKYQNPELAKRIYKNYKDNLKYCFKCKKTPLYYWPFMALLKPISYLFIFNKFKK